uniref:Uncharacterized protein n=1 Tax=Branchiostoma floridae TaxID=7739 RepID=C3YJS4_BRAFL|eukprot:XP_002603370.1 hypothetical protein BRAFLDRAFT_80363 [Branchiostoma floridae]
MQTDRAALGVALRVCPRTAVPTYTRPATGVVLVHTAPTHPSGSQQNCLRPDMGYKTGHADWSGLDLGLFIGAGVLITAGLYEHKRAQATHTPSEVPPDRGVQYVPSVNSQYTGLNLVPLAPQTPAGVLCRSATFPLGKNDNADRKVSECKASRGDKKDQQVFAQFGRPAVRNEETTSTEEDNKCPRDVSDETPTVVSPVKMRDKALSTAEDVRTASTESKKTSGDAVDEGENKEMFNDAVSKGESPMQSSPPTKERADHDKAAVSSENDVTMCDDDQGPAKELMTSNSDISDQRSPSVCPLGGGQVSEGNAEKGHDLCGDDITSDVTNDVMNTCDLPDHTDGEKAGNDVISMSERQVLGALTSQRQKSSQSRHVPFGTSLALLHESDYESGHLSQHVPVCPRLQRKLRFAVLYADWREHSHFRHRHDVTTNQKVRFSWFGQEDAYDDELDDVTEVKVYCAVLAGVWREECGLVENQVTNTTGGDDGTESYYPGHGRRNGIHSGNENWS